MLKEKNKNQKIKIKIDGRVYPCFKGEKILEVAQRNNIFIPSLCHYPDLDVKATCRVCLVEIKDSGRLVTSCSSTVSDGLEIITNSAKVKAARDTNLKLIFSAHIEKCLNCTSRFSCALLSFAKQYKLNIASFDDRKKNRKTYKFANSVEIDGSQCIDCQNCISACSNIQKINYLKKEGGGCHQEIVPTKDKNIDCIYCGQCTLYCPVASAQEQSNWESLEKLLANKKGKKVIAIFAPATRVSIGEAFGLPYSHNSAGKMINALKRLGFDQVIDVNFGADITSLVEAEELLERLVNKKAKLPLITSCCPAWVKYLEFYRPDLIPHLTTSRSPQIHLGGVIKTYWAKEKNLKAQDIVVVSVMPCTAKKFESRRPELKVNGFYPIDEVITVRELAFLIKKKGIDLKKIKAEKTNDLFNDGSGAGVIFGASGGVMEAALRSAQYFTSKTQKIKSSPLKLEFKELRGLQGIKEAEVNLGRKKLKLAIVNGIANIDNILPKLNNYHYIEVMACPGGCVGGGGQIIPTSKEIIKKRMVGLYNIDKNEKIRTAHDNLTALKVIQWLKDNNLSQQVLYTKYLNRKKDIKFIEKSKKKRSD